MKMCPQEQLNPYLNRFTLLVKQNASAKLEFNCLNGKVTVNLFHDLGVVEKTSPATVVQNPEEGPVFKKNVSLSQIVRLKKRAAERAENPKQEDDQKKARNEAEKANNEITKAAEDVSNTLEAKAAAEKAKLEAEKTK